MRMKLLAREISMIMHMEGLAAFRADYQIKQTYKAWL